ncbi:MAG: hypothetical protein WCI77_01945 [Candidatus Omnitrophota bacterium]
MWFFNRKPKRLSSPLLGVSLNTILVVDDEPFESIQVSLESSLRIGKVLASQFNDYYGISVDKSLDLLNEYNHKIIVNLRPGNANEEKLDKYCKAKNIRMLRSTACTGTKISNLATISPLLIDINFLLDVGVELSLAEVEAVVGSLSEFERNENLGMLIGNKRRGALATGDFISNAISGGGIGMSLVVKKEMGNTFGALLTLLELRNYVMGHKAIGINLDITRGMGKTFDGRLKSMERWNFTKAYRVKRIKNIKCL